jgi:hypothetical protein
MTPLIDPREMRKVLNEVARGRIDHRLHTSIIVRTCLDQGYYLGYSGEDTMTVLAYHLMLENERLMELVLSDVATRISPLVVKAEAGGTSL